MPITIPEPEQENSAVNPSHHYQKKSHCPYLLKRYIAYPVSIVLTIG
jgi:hypothetical protein